jgi:2-iminobutanoate/2-iminopropanoate deaminase
MVYSLRHKLTVTAALTLLALCAAAVTQVFNAASPSLVQALSGRAEALRYDGHSTAPPQTPVAQALRPANSRRVIRPEKFPNTGLPYSPGILVNDTLYLSGQLGRDPVTAKLVPGGIEAEARQVLANIREVLKAAGMDFHNVVSVTAFIASFDDFATFNDVYRQTFATEPPARATVQVAGLNLGARVELQMIAVRSARP